MSEYIPKYKIDWSKEKRLKEKPGYMGEFTFDLIQQLYIKCDEKDKKIERLNAILTDLEEWLVSRKKSIFDELNILTEEEDTQGYSNVYEKGELNEQLSIYYDMQDKIQELKEKYK